MRFVSAVVSHGAFTISQSTAFFCGVFVVFCSGFNFTCGICARMSYFLHAGFEPDCRTVKYDICLLISVQFVDPC